MPDIPGTTSVPTGGPSSVPGGPSPPVTAPETSTSGAGAASPSLAIPTLTAGTGAGAGGPGAAPSPGPPAFVGVRDALRNLGINLDAGDDHTALQRLAQAYQAHQQAQPLLPYAQEYMRNAAQFRQWQAAQQAAAQAQQAQQQKWWNAPEYDPSWMHKVMRDPQTGELRVLPGNDPAILAKLQAASEHRATFLDKFAFDPINAIKPGLEEMVREMASQIVQENMGNYQERNFASNYVAQNTSWIHARDAQGQPLRDPQTGAPRLSDAGQRYAGYVQGLEQSGITNIQLQAQLAERLVKADLAMAQLAQVMGGQQAAAQGEAQKQQFLQQAAAQGGPTPANYGTPAATPQNQPRMRSANDLFRAMTAEFQQAGTNVTLP